MIRILLVVGDNHKEIAAKYSDTNGEKNKKEIIATSDEIAAEYEQHVLWVKDVIKNNKEGAELLEKYTQLLDNLNKVTPSEYYKELVPGCDIDDKGNAYIMVNPSGCYSNERCGQEALEKTGSYGGLSQPFITLDDEDTFVTTKGEVDWELIHMNPGNIEWCSAIWEMCMEGRKPENEDELRDYENMKNRLGYLSSFPNKESFVKHRTSFWCYGIADEDKCIMSNKVCKTPEDELAWISEFYNTYIKPMPDDTVIALYDIKVAD